MSKFYAVLCLMVFSLSWSQDDRQLLNGKVIAEFSELEGIHIINISSNQSALTQSGGYFSINAEPRDTLMFSAVQFKGRQIALSEADFKSDLFFVKLEVMVNPLDEVRVIRYDKINAVSLGIIPKGQKSYTPAERKLRTATSLSPGGGGTIGVDPLINWLSGRTAMLKKEVQVEKREFLLKKIADMFEEIYFTQQLNIPSEYVDGFRYYIIENERLVAAINAKNRTMSEFIMAELAVAYNKMISGE